ncbi:hypothetical protein [Nonomuraea dietziae]|uniref:hypothetical protein n=1 Tax=Nonomuraea dietziae TaxID=65515 RepID=UPI0033F011CC
MLRSVRRRHLSVLAMSLVLAGAATASLATPATAGTQAIDGCWGDAGTVGPNQYGAYHQAKYCHNFRGGDVYNQTYGDYTVTTGYLNAGTNWFVCQRRKNENPPTPEGYRNNIWLYTQADTAYDNVNKGYGGFPANRVSSSTGD